MFVVNRRDIFCFLVVWFFIPVAVFFSPLYDYFVFYLEQTFYYIELPVKGRVVFLLFSKKNIWKKLYELLGYKQYNSFYLVVFAFCKAFYILLYIII